MSETRHTGRSAYRAGLAAPNRPPRAEDYVWPMPTVEEVVARGYAPEYHQRVAEMRADEIRRFNEDEAYRRDQVERGPYRDRCESCRDAPRQAGYPWCKVCITQAARP